VPLKMVYRGGRGSQERNFTDPDAVSWEDGVMHFDLTEAETLTLLNLLIETMRLTAIRCRRAPGSCRRSSPSAGRPSSPLP
jgi:hypothetical protein